MFKKILNKINETKGMSSIEFIIGMFIMLIFITFIYDGSLIVRKYYVANEQANFLVRTMGIQGGLGTQVPAGFGGGNKTYATSSEVYNKVSKNLARTGIKDCDVYLTTKNKNNTFGNVKNVKLTPKTTARVDYRGSIDVSIKVKYKWIALAPFVGNDEKEFIVNRHAISEFKYNYDVWKGEQ